MNKPKIALGGAGFYIVLLLCLMVVGVSGYMILFHGSTAAEADAAAASADADLYGDLDPEGPSLEILEPQTIKEPDEESAPANAPVEMPSVQVDDTPVTATAPNLVVWPLRGAVVSAFSVDELLYDETMGDWRTHAGVDLAAEAGTQVMAASAGTVSAVENDPLMGTTVMIDHAGGYRTTYANLQAVPTVKVGDAVSAGQIIGAVGNTAIAEASVASHLHFAVEKDGDAVDPQTFLKD
ncbi:M23 family metallopeptidase [Oscillibacter ruminantium]|jgi:murein DD-endopeptidase MepM/ murein hydrolase activator NlpD|uniref:M23 family metallopeptidase n=1 Tax=Oscillibacter ruminantium TaxID=1263547 RepID=UPI0002DE3301|nr:M23 family metallopeptidase [Oscillibacter ruminantium]MDN0032146.1 M23 family metallopeptidase [Oscillibacter valericigenes]MEA5042420.1 M23 family metallopeptidase [Oscillibacter ruminantium]